VPRTFLFSDLRGYASYVERSGDAAASRLLRTYRGIVRRAIAREKGAEIKTEGDSFYVVFSSSGDAVRCAVAIQRAAARRPGEELAIGIGIHAGEVVAFDRQYVGSAVNIASRLASAAAPGEILVSETVRSLIRTAVRFPFDERGPLTLKGITEPIRVYAIGGVDRPQPPHVETAPLRPMDAVARGDLDRAAQIVRSMRQQASANERCDALAALAIVAATRGDVEMALRRTEQMLPLALRAAEASWLRAAYALRAWLYSLARQPGEARAELARAHQRPGESSDACLLMLLAVTMEGSAAHAGHLRRMASACPERSWGGACAVVADALEGRLDAGAAYNAVAGAGAPFMAALVGFQLASRAGETGEREFQATIARSGGSRLAELILAARQ
jgi:class 3 adenylate cyclase